MEFSTSHNVKTLDDFLHINMVCQSPMLDIANVIIDEFPKELVDYNWVKTVSIRRSTLLSIKNLPSHMKEFRCIQLDQLPINNIEWPPMVTTIYFEFCSIAKLCPLPTTLNRFIADNCLLEEITPNTLPQRIQTISLASNKIKKCAEIPDSTESLDISDNVLTIFESPLPNIKILKINNNALNHVPNVGITLESLDISDNVKITMLQRIETYVNLTELDCANCRIENLDNLKSLHNLKKLWAFGNVIKSIDELPDSLEIVDMSHNNIKKLTKVPKNIKELDLSHNMLEVFNVDIPESLKELDLTNNKIRGTPPKILEHHMKVSAFNFLNDDREMLGMSSLGGIPHGEFYNSDDDDVYVPVHNREILESTDDLPDSKKDDYTMYQNVSEYGTSVKEQMLIMQLIEKEKNKKAKSEQSMTVITAVPPLKITIPAEKLPEQEKVEEIKCVGKREEMVYTEKKEKIEASTSTDKQIKKEPTPIIHDENWMKSKIDFNFTEITIKSKKNVIVKHK